MAALDLLEERANELGIDADGLFRLWFNNHAPEDVQAQFNELAERHKDASPSELAIDLIDDIVDVWLDDDGDL